MTDAERADCKKKFDADLKKERNSKSGIEVALLDAAIKQLKRAIETAAERVRDLDVKVNEGPDGPPGEAELTFGRWSPTRWGRKLFEISRTPREWQALHQREFEAIRRTIGEGGTSVIDVLLAFLSAAVGAGAAAKALDAITAIKDIKDAIQGGADIASLTSQIDAVVQDIMSDKLDKVLEALDAVISVGDRAALYAAAKIVMAMNRELEKLWARRQRVGGRIDGIEKCLYLLAQWGRAPIVRVKEGGGTENEYPEPPIPPRRLWIE